jgi:NADPH:quinone reductase-like Zn-dependent oxidoreductase
VATEPITPNVCCNTITDPQLRAVHRCLGSNRQTMMMKAFMTRILRGPGLTSVQVPKPEPGELQIKVAYVSLNPTDCSTPVSKQINTAQILTLCTDFHAAISLPPSKIVGCDFSGTVTALGKGVNRSKFSKGDRIAGVVHGCKDSRSGAFAQTIVADAGMCWKVPNNVSLEAASTSGVGWMSATQALAQRLYRDEKETSEDDTVRVSQKHMTKRNMG